MEKKIVCIICPRGCNLTIFEKDGAITVEGNACKRGAEYAATEITCPVRTLTTTVKIESVEHSVLPVRTDKPIKKSEIFCAMKEVAKITVKAPVKSGDVIACDFMDKGVNLISAKTVEK